MFLLKSKEFWKKNKMLKKFLLVVMWAIFGLVFVLGKKSLEYFHFLDFITLRMFAAGLCFGVLWFFLEHKNKHCKESNKRLQRASIWAKNIRSELLFLLVALTHVFLPFILEYWATTKLGPSKISVIYSFSPFVSGVIASWLHEEKLTFNKKAGLFLGWFGMVLPLFFASDFSLVFPSWADGALILAVVFASSAWFMIEVLLARGNSIIFINFFSTLFSSMLFLFVRFLFFDHLPNLTLAFFSQIPPLGWLWLGSVFFLSNLIGYSLYGYLLNFYSPTALSLSGFMCPVFAHIFASLILAKSLPNIFVALSVWFGLTGFFLYSKK